MIPNVNIFLSCLEEVRNNKASRSCKAEILLHFAIFVQYSFELYIVMQINSEGKIKTVETIKKMLQKKDNTLLSQEVFVRNCIHLEQFPFQVLVLSSSPHANRTKTALQTKEFFG